MNERIDRRQFLQTAGSGIGAVALAGLLADESGAAPHFPAKVKRIVHVFCVGGVSHVDTFDHKPGLAAADGKELTGYGKVETFFGQPGRLMRPRWEFRPRGKSGKRLSDLLPHLADCVDDMTFLHGMVSKSSNHTPATFFMNSGFTLNGFPCLGAWVGYGLGALSRDLPAFVVLPDPRGQPAGGAINWTNGFLPASFQGTALQAKGDPVPNLFPPPEVSAARRRAELSALAAMNREHQAQNPGDSLLAARIASYELAARMQLSVPKVTDLSKETAETRALYGLDAPATAAFGRNCLLARRLLEQGVRVVQLYHGGAFGSPRINWDAHEDIIENHTKQAASMDQPVAGLLKDLKRRGMLDDTLLLWTTEFGRTPFTQGIGAPGRDHHPDGFTIWMAGAGLKPGFSYGQTDEIGFKPVEGRTEVYDVHATILRLMGLDHKRLTYYHNGINRRLTDVHGSVIEGILA